MEEELLLLKRILMENGGVEIVANFEATMREATPPPGVRSQVSYLLDELNAILVEAPFMVSATMEMLGAQSLVFSRDVLDALSEGEEVQLSGSLEPVNTFSIRPDQLAAWDENAIRAREFIARFRETYNV